MQFTKGSLVQENPPSILVTPCPGFFILTLDLSWTFPRFVEWYPEYTTDSGANWVSLLPVINRVTHTYHIDLDLAATYAYRYRVRTKFELSPFSPTIVAGIPLVVISGFEGGDLTYHYNQGISTTVWTIDHNLGKHPSVQVFTSAGDKIEGDVQHTSVNQLVITFSSAFAGDAYLN